MPAAAARSAPPTDTAPPLRYQRCGWCAAADFLPRALCRLCGSDDLVWEESAGSGYVHHAVAVPRADRRPGQHAVVVALDEGFQLPGVVVGAAARPVPVDARVRVVSVPGTGRRRPVFRLVRP
ncbi:zinc ribbon domain-containing protein [Kitasatospora sp. YST-16]|uniref:Zn-ribbon domain-containing OB-fold protein n=1 Tax=Kitasatospora sp. YST-16 TaxID=2998080 RepID=UPI002283560C|nr:zinc ribbon domain-containing protein [Kitasatospora sp. YST-16]WAL74705.1 zinc ribbon domain-containing protein [Kitasatospora sp. YST-16]WNW40759.1 zinc ribbon domain-containing protein [Streptomyces sp. Li-HN-5-13]